jgi:hypothetical protein
LTARQTRTYNPPHFSPGTFRNCWPRFSLCKRQPDDYRGDMRAAVQLARGECAQHAHFSWQGCRTDLVIEKDLER